MKIELYPQDLIEQVWQIDKKLYANGPSIHIELFYAVSMCKSVLIPLRGHTLCTRQSLLP